MRNARDSDIQQYQLRIENMNRDIENHQGRIQHLSTVLEEKQESSAKTSNQIN
jgi:predicted  nucleic acid-binding Zn-ribbon protein